MEELLIKTMYWAADWRTVLICIAGPLWMFCTCKVVRALEPGRKINRVAWCLMGWPYVMAYVFWAMVLLTALGGLFRIYFAGGLQ